ncbi:MAG: NBR1-Ig-like domain-containing protein, partial [Anaerolineae bacterium]|nr:NBR1-Ig-like domain-containing protein [Anaerolineae bacterium]
PTPGAKATVFSLPTPTVFQPTPTEVCEDDLSFLQDVTVPDGMSFPPHATIEKVWRVKNEGTCNWTTGYQIRLISGPNMSAEAEQALFPARSGSEAEIRIVFIAPNSDGAYRSSWQAHNPAGEPFGDPIFIDIYVDSSLEISIIPTEFTDSD